MVSHGMIISNEPAKEDCKRKNEEEKEWQQKLWEPQLFETFCVFRDQDYCDLFEIQRIPPIGVAFEAGPMISKQERFQNRQTRYLSIYFG